MAMWDTTDFLSRVKRKAQWPSDAKLTDDQLLDIADEEGHAYIAPLVRIAAEAFWVKRYTTPLVSGQPLYRIPYRTTGGTVYDVSVQDSTGRIRRLSKVQASEIYMFASGLQSALSGIPTAYCIEGDQIRIMPIPSSPLTLVVRFERRPSKLVQTTSCVQAATVSSMSLTTAAAMSGFSGTVDIVQARPNFDSLLDDATAVQSGSGPYTYTFTQTLTDVIAGDWMCPPGQSCVVQYPDPLYPIIIDRVAAQALEEAGDRNLANDIRAGIELKLNGVMKALEPRAETSSPAIYNKWGTLRGG